MIKLAKNRKAVSPIIASLLLIAIAVAAGVLTYSWVINMVDTQSAQAQTQLRIDIVEFSDGNTTAVTVRNSGTVGVTIDTIYVINSTNNVETLEYASVADDEKFSADSASIPSGSTTQFTCTLGTANFFAEGAAYKIKILTDNGFAVEGTYYPQAGLLAST